MGGFGTPEESGDFFKYENNYILKGFFFVFSSNALNEVKNRIIIKAVRGLLGWTPTR